jgi:hypothetical protein
MCLVLAGVVFAYLYICIRYFCLGKKGGVLKLWLYEFNTEAADNLPGWSPPR